MKFKLLYRFLLTICTFCLANIPSIVLAQTYGQKELLEEAYETKSNDLLAKFFDNWQKELKDNEAEAPDKWVAEAHKVFAAICSPENTSRNGLVILDSILVVQSSLDKIGYVKRKSNYFRHGELDTTAYVPIDSAIDFRPNLKNHTIVYLTEDYKDLLKEFISTFSIHLLLDDIDNWELTEPDNVWEKTNEDGTLDYIDSQFDRVNFLRQYGADIGCLHFLSFFYEIVPFITIKEIIFDHSLKYAVVTYEECMSGRTVVLKRKGDKWVFDHCKSMWIE